MHSFLRKFTIFLEVSESIATVIQCVKLINFHDSTRFSVNSKYPKLAIVIATFRLTSDLTANKHSRSSEHPKFPSFPGALQTEFSSGIESSITFLLWKE